MSTKHLFKNAHNSPIDNHQRPKVVRRPPQPENGFWVSFIVNYHDTVTQMNLRNTLLSKRNLTSNSKYWMIHSTYMQLQNRPIYFTGGGGKNKNNGGSGEEGGGAPHLSLPLSPHLLERTEAPGASAALSTRCHPTAASLNKGCVT